MNKIAFPGTLLLRAVILFVLLFSLVLIILHLQMKLWKQKVISSYLRHKILQKELALDQREHVQAKFSKAIDE